MKRCLIANVKRVSERIKDKINHDQLVHFYEFMFEYTDIFTKNIFTTKDYSYHNLRVIMMNQDTKLSKVRKTLA